MVNTELFMDKLKDFLYYNILNIVVNTERQQFTTAFPVNYNILNIVVNTELLKNIAKKLNNYNILNIVVNTEQYYKVVFS